MKVVVWRGCVVVREDDYPDAQGPDVHIDPWNLPNSASIRTQTERGEVHHMVQFPVGDGDSDHV